MGSYSAIADASETLVELLRDRIAEREDAVGIDRGAIGLVSPADVGADSDVRLSLHCYAIEENSVMKNADRQVLADDSRRDPPLSLDLQYLLTAYPAGGGNDESAAVLDQQRLLGLAMQIFNDNAIVGGDDLQGSLGEDDPRLHLSLEPEDSYDLATIWTAFGDTPLYPSVSYHVSPVTIESTVTEEVSPVQQREAAFDQRDRDDAGDYRHFDDGDDGSE